MEKGLMTYNTFNQIFVLMLTFFSMAMITYAYVTGKPIVELLNLLGLSLPVILNIAHLVIASQVASKSVEATTQVQVAQIKKETINGTSG